MKKNIRKQVINMYKYFQPNKKDLKDRYGDCAIRALCKAQNMEWLDAYDLMWKLTREVQCPFNSKYGFESIMKQLGYTYGGISNKKGTVRPSVRQFAKQNPKGTYICVVANHYVTIVDGDYYDTWDSGSSSMYGYWKRGE
jgi:hypothetical protein